MPPAARITDVTTHGTPLAPGPGSLNVIIGGMPAWRAMIDQHACPAVSITGADGVGSVVMGSPTVLINGMMACRMGDIVVEKPGLALGPANPILMGCMTVMIGDGAAAGGAGVPTPGGGGGGGGGGTSADAPGGVSGGAGSGSSESPVAASALGPGAQFASGGSGGPSGGSGQCACMVNAAATGAPFVGGASPSDT